MKKILLDTNILVPLEDNGVVPEQYSKLIRKAQERGGTLYCHRASFEDVARDKDLSRRKTSISKLEKYLILEKSDRNEVQLETQFGAISKPNDESDCQILSSVFDNAADILVTEDADLHRRAEKIGLGSKVFRVRQLLDFFDSDTGSLEGTLSYVENRYCYQLDRNDPIFNSLRLDYNGFDVWWQKCCNNHRKAWVVKDGDSIAGIVVYNLEDRSSSGNLFAAEKILKLCTFKVSEKHRGGRLGEQLLKQAMWHANSAKLEVVYLTVFEKQTSLVDLLMYYGFQIHSLINDELVYAKNLNSITQAHEEYDWHRLNYPRLKPSEHQSVIVPIRPEFHKRLLPEATSFKKGTTIDLFDQVWTADQKDSHIPATAIRKVYVCKAQVDQISAGTRVYFYITKNDQLAESQSLTAIGILEEYRPVHGIDDLLKSTAKRSVYRMQELQKFVEQKGTPKILNFILVGVCEPKLSLRELISFGVVKGAPQSIVQLDEAKSEILASKILAKNLA
jgi:predicted nucleic acid-binding protein